MLMPQRRLVARFLIINAEDLVFRDETETSTETQLNVAADELNEVPEIKMRWEWSGRVDLNHRLHGPEPCALPS